MNCDEAHDLLQQCLDGSPIESPEWLTHLRHCADCRTLASAGRRLHDGLHLLSSPLPPTGLAERIVERLRLDRRRARSRARRRLALSLALAAGLIVALSLRLNWQGATDGTNTRPPDSVVKNAPEREGASQVHTDQRREPDYDRTAPTLRQSAAELGEVFTSLSNQTADETLGQTRLWAANVPSPSLPKLDLASMEPPTRPLREAGEGVSEGLEPVTTSARRAVDLFLRELPMEPSATN
jgi:hypothetical protein